jgi:hypothetical protein
VLAMSGGARAVAVAHRTGGGEPASERCVWLCFLRRSISLLLCHPSDLYVKIRAPPWPGGGTGRRKLQARIEECIGPELGSIGTVCIRNRTGLQECHCVSQSRSRSRKIWISKTRKEFLPNRSAGCPSKRPAACWIERFFEISIGQSDSARSVSSHLCISLPSRLALSCRVLQLLLTLIPSLNLLLRSSSSAPSSLYSVQVHSLLLKLIGKLEFGSE